MRKIFTLLILLLLLPVAAGAVDAPATLYVGNQQVISGTETTYWKTNDSGELEKVKGATDTSKNWNVKYDPNSATLTLSWATITGSGGIDSTSQDAGIYALCSSNNPVSLTIKLIGTNTITGSYGIYVDAQQGGTVGTNASLLIQNSDGDDSLEVSGSFYGIFVKSGTGNASVTIENASVDAKTTQTISGSGYAGVYVQSSSEAKSPQLSLAVNGGSLTTSASEGNDGIQFYVGAYGVTSATTSLSVTNNAIVDARNGGISAKQISNPINTDISATGSNGGIVFDGTEGTVYGNVELQEDLKIGEGESLTVPEGSSLNCNKKLTNNGTILASGGTVTGSLSSGTAVTTPSITAQPTGQTVTEGSAAEFSVTASAGDSETLTYQWQQSIDSGSSWTNIESATSASYTISSTATDMSGNQYRCVVKSASGVGVISDAATLTVNQSVSPTSYSISADVDPAGAGTVTVNGSDTSASVAAGSEVTLTATANDSYRFTGWMENDRQVSTDATYTFKATGDRTLTAKFEKKVTGVTLNTETLELFTGGSATLTATVEPGNATNKAVTWSTSDNTVATVDENGTVTAVGAGEATITVTTEDGSKTATCQVTVLHSNLKYFERKEASCTEPGNIEYWYCEGCNKYFSDEAGTTEIKLEDVVIPATGHHYVNGYCTECGHRDPDYRPDPISYYNIYVEDVCDGVEVTTSKNVVREGGSVSVYVKKDTVNYTFDNFKVYYKRSYYGTWDELKEGTQPGEYPIKNIWTHIYIKAEGAEEKEDPTGIESIEGVKVYTKDGSLYVQTPQREQVIIVSMSGAVVKNEEQIGLKQYHGLQPGIYIVRVGDRAYKVRLN